MQQVVLCLHKIDVPRVSHFMCLFCFSCYYSFGSVIPMVDVFWLFLFLHDVQRRQDIQKEIKWKLIAIKAKQKSRNGKKNTHKLFT